MRSLKAVNDLNIGNHIMNAGKLAASNLIRGRVLVSNSNSIISDNEKFTFAAKSGMLTVPAIRVNKIAMGDIEAKGVEIKSV